VVERNALGVNMADQEFFVYYVDPLLNEVIQTGYLEEKSSGFWGRFFQGIAEATNVNLKFVQFDLSKLIGTAAQSLPAELAADFRDAVLSEQGEAYNLKDLQDKLQRGKRKPGRLDDALVLVRGSLRRTLEFNALLEWGRTDRLFALELVEELDEQENQEYVLPVKVAPDFRTMD